MCSLGDDKLSKSKVYGVQDFPAFADFQGPS